jgi:hypothetical protein
MRRRMMNRQGSHNVAVNESLGTKDEHHVNQRSTCAAV